VTEESVARGSTHGFLFADLRDYSSFAETHGDDAAAALLARYRAIVREVIAQHDGAEIRTEGDSFYVVFPSASTAVRGGMAIVDAARTAIPPILLGVGVHAGETAETGEGPVGSAVNIAARVCAQAGPGELLVTDTVRSLTRTRLEFRFVPRGSPTLKGIQEPIALYRVVARDDPEALALAAAPPAPRAGKATASAPRFAVPRRGRALGLGVVASLIGLTLIAFSLVRLLGSGTTLPPSGSVPGSSVIFAIGPTTRPPTATSPASPSSVVSTASPTADPPLSKLSVLWRAPQPPVEQARPGTYWPAIDPATGEIWAASPFDSRFWIFDAAGTYLRSWPSGDTQFKLTRHQGADAGGSVAFAPDGTFFVLDSGNERVEKFDKSGKLLLRWGSFGNAPGQFVSPAGIATDGKEVYVVDDSPAGMQVFDASGKPLRQFPFPGVLFTLAPNGHLFGSSQRQSVDGGDIVEFDGNGNELRRYPVSAQDMGGGGLGQVAVDDAGHIYVSIQDRHAADAFRLIEMDTNGTVIDRWSSGGETDAITPDGRAIYFAYTGPQGNWSYIEKDALPGGAPVSTYRGNPARTDVMPGPGPAGTPRIEWDVPLGGSVANAAPVVVDGTVYIGDALGDGSGNVEAYVESTGELVWRRALPAPVTASVAVDDGRVFVGSQDGIITALDAATGKDVLWSAVTRGAVSSSPVVVDGIVYVGSQDGFVYALDATTGSQAWPPYRAPGPISRSIALSDGVVYVPSDGGTLVVLDAAQGTELWRVALGSASVLTFTPAVAGGVVYESVGKHDTPATQGVLFAIDLRTHVPLWQYSADSSATLFVGAVANGMVYADSFEDNALRAVDVLTGKQSWVFMTEGRNGAGAAVVGQTVYLASDDGTVHALDATSGEELWSESVDGAPGTLTVVDGRVLFGTDAGRLISIAGTPSPTAP
jgi:outer membrane protein assembly factor BamB/class 3 adenylate cyclase